MTLLARPEEVQEQAVNVESPAGKGVLYVTSMGIILEIYGRGIYMDLRHEVIVSVTNTDRNKIVISWIENGKDNFSFEFRMNDADEFTKKLTKKYNYSANFTDYGLKEDIIQSENVKYALQNNFVTEEMLQVGLELDTRFFSENHDKKARDLFIPEHKKRIEKMYVREFKEKLKNPNEYGTIQEWIEENWNNLDKRRKLIFNDSVSAEERRREYEANKKFAGRPVKLSNDEKENVRNQRISELRKEASELESHLRETNLQIKNVEKKLPKATPQETLPILEERQAIFVIRDEIQNKIDPLEKTISILKTMPVTRSSVIPKEIDSVNVWNDCYYDTSKKAYVTFNKRFEQMKNARTRDIQVKFDKEVGKKSGIIIEESRIIIKYGIPAISAKTQDGDQVWHLLPTMTDEMLTDEIVTNRLNSKTYDDTVFYETVSERWINIGTNGIRLTEKENEVGKKTWSFLNDITLEQLKFINHRK